MKEILSFVYEIAELDGEKRRLVNARDLHKQLEIDTRFNDWINRYLLKLGFIQGIDYIVKKFDYSKMSNQKGRGGDRRSETYLVTVETAKHLAMMAKTPKGKEVRQYFIDVERQWRKRMLEDQRLANTMRRLAENEGLFSITRSAAEISKALGINISVQDLNGFLKEDGFRHRHWYNKGTVDVLWRGEVVNTDRAGYRQTTPPTKDAKVWQCMLKQKGINRLIFEIERELVWIMFLAGWIEYQASK